MSKDYDPRIAEARRIARQLSRERGTPYQSALEEIAVGAGATSWSAFVTAPVAVEPPAIRTSQTHEDELQRANDKDLIQRLAIGMLGTAVFVVFATCLVVGSAYIDKEWWSWLAETVGTVFAIMGFVVVPTSQSGYLIGVRLWRTPHIMTVGWRIMMALHQGGLIVLVARHYLLKL